MKDPQLQVIVSKLLESLNYMEVTEDSEGRLNAMADILIALDSASKNLRDILKKESQTKIV